MILISFSSTSPIPTGPCYWIFNIGGRVGHTHCEYHTWVLAIARKARSLHILMLVCRRTCSSHSPWNLALERWCCSISWLIKEARTMNNGSALITTEKSEIWSSTTPTNPRNGPDTFPLLWILLREKKGLSPTIGTSNQTYLRLDGVCIQPF